MLNIMACRIRPSSGDLYLSGVRAHVLYDPMPYIDVYLCIPLANSQRSLLVPSGTMNSTGLARTGPRRVMAQIRSFRGATRNPPQICTFLSLLRIL